MKLQKTAGATSEIWQVFIRDSSSTTGGGLTGLVFNTASLTAYYHRDTDTTATAITLVTMTVGTFTSSGFKEIDATNMPGWYQFCPPNAALASGAKSCAFHLKGATNMAPLPIEVQLTAVNPDSATAFMTSVATVTNLTNLPTIPANWLTAAGMDATASAEIADAVWDEAIAGHLGAGSTGAALNAAGAAGDPWTTPLPGAYVAGTAGYIVGTNLDAQSSTLATAANLAVVAGYLDTEIAGIKAKTDLIPAAPAAVGDIPTAVENADALLGRNVSGGSSAGRTVKQALHVLRNKSAVAAGTLTVYDTDDTTSSWTAAVSQDAAAEPITGIDPA